MEHKEKPLQILYGWIGRKESDMKSGLWVDYSNSRLQSVLEVTKNREASMET